VALVTPVGEPGIAVAGLSWKWKIPDSSTFPNSDGWSLKYRAAGVDIRDIDPVFQTSGDDDQTWLTNVTGEKTDVDAGRYRLASWWDDGVDKFARTTVVLRVLPNPTTLEPGDAQAHAERMIPILELAIEGRLTDQNGLESYSIGSQSFSKMTVGEMRRLVNSYRAELWLIRHPRRVVPIGRARFGPPV
jgi:hypothetical protein